ncbi:MAG: acyltransferase family protein [Actinomycetales bacterium]|nr:acyltransferase family protein [Actinomycetales bacterium]
MTADSSPRPGARDPFLDNARGILITLVVVGHTLECFDVIGDVLGGTLYKAIYSFHMAAFVIISGHLSRSYRNEPRQVRRLLTAMLVPYVIFQMVHEAGKSLLLGEDFELQLITPAWTLWFLLALMLWRLTTPVLRQLRHPLVFAVAVSVIVPLDPDLDSTLSLGRLAGMLPFFVLGLVCTPQVLERIRSFRHRWMGALVLASAVLCAFLLREDVPSSSFYLRSAYDDEATLPWSAAVRLGVLVVGVVGTLALLLVTPRGQSVLTVVGSRSLTIYLLHTVLLLPIRYAEELPGWVESWWGTGALVGLGAALTAVLATGIVGRLTRWITDPPIGQWLIRPDAEQTRQGRG